MALTGALLSAFAVTFLAMKVLEPLAVRWGLVDHPGGRKKHCQPTPLIGGIAMLVGVLVSTMFLSGLSAQVLPFLVAALLLVGVGLIDDRYDLRWSVKMLAQVIAVLIMAIGAGVYVKSLGPLLGPDELRLGWVAIPFTMLAAVGLINAVNMIDGSDGLAGSVALASMLIFAFLGLSSGHAGAVSHLVPVIGALCAFLWFNLRFPWQPKARAFMGDAGSMLLGLVLAWVVIQLTQSKAYAVAPVLAPWLMAPAVIDCLTVIMRRLRMGKSPFSPGRDHLHHLLLEAGYGPTAVALIISVATLLLGIGALLAHHAGVSDLMLAVSFVALSAGYFFITRRRARAVRVFGMLRRKPVPEVVAEPLVD